MKAFAWTIIAFLVTAGSAWAAGGAPAHKPSLIANMDCNACHTSAGWKLGPGAGSGSGFDHSKTGFPLAEEHARTSCSGCHSPEKAITRDCAGCHVDSHEGRFGAKCDGCHRPTSWGDTRVLEDHRRTLLPLTGMHAMIDCTACHLRTGERAFSETPSECYACHEKDYRASSTHPTHLGSATAAPFPRNCGLCHTAVGWTPAFLPTAFASSPVVGAAAPTSHDRIFPVRSGKHRGVACESCHAGNEHTGTVDCGGCHEHSPLAMLSAHRGRTMPSDARACLGCHPAGAAR